MGRVARLGAAVATGLLTAALVAPTATADNRVDVIVVYADGVTNSHATTAAVAPRYDARTSHVYEHALEGFAGSVPEGRLNGLRNDPRVDYVEIDQEVSIAAQTVPTGVRRIFADDNSSIDIDGSDDLRVDVDVAVIDTGIDLDHPDLNVFSSVDCSGGSPFSSSCQAGGDDDHSHGTHVAGTIAALDNGIGVVGVAPGARLHAVKVLRSNGMGYNSWIIAGIDHVTARGDIEVANLSLGGGESSAVDDALSSAANSGVALALAAGNEDQDVDGVGPAGHPKALTVSALADFDGEPGGLAAHTCREDEDDTIANFSNWGDKSGDDVDIIAPGVCILSTVPGGYDTFSGTSMASPHVAGGLALLTSGGDTTSFTEVQSAYDALLANGNDNWNASQDEDSTKEPLLDVTGITPTMVGVDGGGGTNASPTASFTFTCTDLACDFDGTGSSDSDGSIASYAWHFGDGTTASGQTISHTYTSSGNYTVILTVTDDDSATDSDSQVVSVSEAGDFSLSATGYKVRGLQKADLSWSGATTDLDVYRNGDLVTTTANDGFHTDNIDQRGGGSYTYQVCEAGTLTCSNTSTVVF